ncbi:MAG: hypothetical protein LUE93_15570 [Bacteroides sp.]|nr:hypothetical protein [Bacteroides sp.]
MLTFVSYLLSALVWFSLMFYLVLPDAYVALSPLITFSYSALYVVSYRFVFQVTKTGDTQKFPGVHYLLPVLGFVVILCCTFVVPFQQQVEALLNPQDLITYRWVAMLFKALPLWMILFNLTYAILGLIRAKRYHKTVVNYSADVQRASLR